MKDWERMIGRLLGLLPMRYRNKQRGIMGWFEHLRFRFAQYIDHKYIEACWSNLVNWALELHWNHYFGFDFWDRWDFWVEQWDAQHCRQWYKGTPYAYCGKCEVTGRYYGKEKRE